MTRILIFDKNELSLIAQKSARKPLCHDKEIFTGYKSSIITNIFYFENKISTIGKIDR